MARKKYDIKPKYILIPAAWAVLIYVIWLWLHGRGLAALFRGPNADATNTTNPTSSLPGQNSYGVPPVQNFLVTPPTIPPYNPGMMANVPNTSQSGYPPYATGNQIYIGDMNPQTSPSPLTNFASPNYTIGDLYGAATNGKGLPTKIVFPVAGRESFGWPSLTFASGNGKDNCGCGGGCSCDDCKSSCDINGGTFPDGRGGCLSPDPQKPSCQQNLMDRWAQNMASYSGLPIFAMDCKQEFIGSTLDDALNADVRTPVGPPPGLPELVGAL
jgi:hypothetical protein